MFAFYLQLKVSKNIKIEQLSCSNLRHLGALVDCALRPGVVSVCKTFHVHENKLLVDVISDKGQTWTKGKLFVQTYYKDENFTYVYIAMFENIFIVHI